MPADPYPTTPAPNTLADATKLRAQLDVLFTDVTERGKSIIATTESTTNTTYTTLATADEITNVTVSANALIVVCFRATWANATGSDGRAAIFIGTNQLKVWSPSSGSPVVSEAWGPTAAGTDSVLSSCAIGLASGDGTALYTGDVTTGLAAGVFSPLGGTNRVVVGGTGYSLSTASLATLSTGLCVIENVAAGNYTISIKYKSLAGASISAKNRRLWVWTMTF